MVALTAKLASCCPLPFAIGDTDDHATVAPQTFEHVFADYDATCLLQDHGNVLEKSIYMTLYVSRMRALPSTKPNAIYS